MNLIRSWRLAALLWLAGPVLLVPWMAAPAHAQATPAEQQAAAAFIESLSADAFAILNDRSISREAARGRFRQLLSEHFAIEQTGMRLIRRYRAPQSPIQLTPQQIEAYRRALPTFLVNTYSDRLYDFAAARLTVVRTLPRGSRGEVDVVTRISDPKGGRPIDATWTVERSQGRPRVANITVNGVNVALTQEADFAAFIDRQGFDALVAFMEKSR